MKKSYHSMVVPMALARATRRESGDGPVVKCDVPSRSLPRYGSGRSPQIHMRNAVLGLICAAALALALSDIAIFGIAIWKIELAVAGALLFITAGKKT